MAKRMLHVRVRISFNSMRKGDGAVVPDSPRVRAWIAGGLLEVIDGGEDQAGSGGAEQDAHERVADGAEGGGPTGGEPGQGFGAGEYGAFA
jgi:hypothetical protein